MSLRRLASRVRSRFSARLGYPGGTGAIVLAYHRIDALASDPQLLAVSPSHFAEQLDVLRRQYQPVSLAHLTEMQGRSRTSRPLVSITFDDGYGDNAREGLILLERFAAPATVFVTTRMIDSAREFWWDELERIILRSEGLPTSLELQVGPNHVSWQLGPESANNPVDERWHVLESCNPGTRQWLYIELHRLIRPLSDDARTQVLGQLIAWSGDAGKARTGYQAMSMSELHKLSQNELVTVGGHTRTHPVLAGLSDPELASEISGCKRDLEQWLGRPVRTFSYPYGGRADYGRRGVRAVRAAGYEAGIANYPARFRSAVDRFQIPRFLVRDWNGDEFTRRLKAFIHP